MELTQAFVLVEFRVDLELTGTQVATLLDRICKTLSWGAGLRRNIGFFAFFRVILALVRAHRLDAMEFCMAIAPKL